jgi:hypothetical protein
MRRPTVFPLPPGLLVVLLALADVSAGGDLHQAVHQGDHQALRTLVAEAPDQIDAPDERGFTALHWAGILDRPRMVSVLLEAGASPGVVGGDGGSPLHWLVHHDHPDLARRMIDVGADVNLANRWGRTPLHVAVRRGCSETVVTLLLAGADPDASTGEGWTPLHVAGLAGRHRIGQLLTRAGADTSAVDREGRRASELWRPRPEPLAIEAARFDEFAGRYAIADGVDLMVWREGSRLRVQEFAPDELIWLGDDRFACRAEPWRLTFQRGDHGQVEAVAVAYLRRTVTAGRRPTQRLVGSSACRPCHAEAWITWARSAHASAYWRLHGDWALALAHQRPHFRDVTDPATDPRCVQCHVTGAMDGPRLAATSWRETEGVGCESCHGPGSAHVDGGQPPGRPVACERCHRRDFERKGAWERIAHGERR